MQSIQEHPVYQQVIKDAFGGVMYNVANQTKYDSAEIIAMWDGLTAPQREASGGIMQGAFNFLKGEN